MNPATETGWLLFLCGVIAGVLICTFILLTGAVAVR